MLDLHPDNTVRLEGAALDELLVDNGRVVGVRVLRDGR